MIELDNILDILKVVVGLVYLYLEYHARRSMWIASIIMPAIGMWLFLRKGLYADCAINVYYLLIAIYGWYVWSFGAKKSDKKTQPISHIKPYLAAIYGGIWLVVWFIIALLLHKFTDSNVVLLDSFTTSLSIIGMVMLAKKYIENWWIWFVVDGVYVYLYYYKGIYFSGSLYAFYTVMAALGYRKWLKLMPQNIDSQP